MSSTDICPPDEERRIVWLDFLRGVSAFAIVLFHVRVTMWIGLRALNAGGYSGFDRLLGLVTLPFPFFGSAVMLFFVVSGFAIHFPYSHPGRTPATREYAVRRFLRIYPPYLVAVLLTLVAESIAVSIGGTRASEWRTVGATLAMVQNELPPGVQMVANPSLWSLPVEAELYVAYPLLFWFWRRTGSRSMVVVVACVSAAAAAATWALEWWPSGNFTQYWLVWVAGAWLAEQMRTHALPRWSSRHRYLLAGVTCTAIGARVAGLPSLLENLIWGGVYYLVVLWGLNHPAPLQRLPAGVTRVALFLGDISYSLYLVHFPILFAVGACWVSQFGQKPTSVVVPLIASLLPIPFAYLLWRFVERPSQAWARRLAHRAPAVSPLPPVAWVDANP